MSELRSGELAPDFVLDSTDGQVRLSDLRGSKALLIFYQEDNTPTCTTQVSAFADDFDVLQELGVRVVAISADGLDAHERFVDKLGGVPFPLASDATLEVARMYDVVDDTGKRTRRAVFVLDSEGRIALAIPWYNPSNFEQYEEIYRALGMDV